jgi:KDO2-lipid IV(A) lauroyltransferase
MTGRLLQWMWRLFSLLPLQVMYVLSDILFFPIYYLGRYRRKVARKNLIESFPEKSRREIRTLEKRFYHFFIDLFFETCKLATLSEKEIRHRMKFTNPEAVDAVLQQGKSISAYMGHYANWEWVTSLPLHLKTQAVAGQIYHKLHNLPLDRLLIRNRERMGALCIEMNQTPRKIHQLALAQIPSIIGYIADQSPRKKHIRHYVPFLNHQTPVLTGAEKLTKRYNFEAWYLDVRRIRRGYYEATFIRLHESPQALPDFQLTDLYYQQLEQIILKQPELYLWTHNRFKHSPPAPLSKPLHI